MTSLEKILNNKATLQYAPRRYSEKRSGGKINNEILLKQKVQDVFLISSN